MDYVIKPGDTLSKIAKENGTTVDDLVRINGIKNPNLIIAGNTLKLTDTSNSPSGAPTTATKESVGFKPSDGLNTKETTKDSATNDWLGLGTHQWDKTEIAEKLLNDYLGREKFNYDFNGDALYQQYKDKYIQQGKMAMQDTMGQAAAMTGGYGNSYASTVGNQAYQAHLNNLNDVIPELYQMAYDRYNQEGQDMLNQYSLLMNDYELSHKNWEDQYNTLKDKASYADSDYWSNYSKENNEYWKETEFSYGQERDAISDASTKAWAMIQAGVVPSDDILGVAGISKEEAQKVANVYNKAYVGGSSSGGSGSGGSGGSNYGNGGGDDDAPLSGDNQTNSGTVPKEITDAVKSAKTNNDKANLLAGYVNDGTISQEQAQEILAQSASVTKDLKDRTWSKTGKDSVNWLWGVDNDDKVKDQYGNIYRLDDLVDALVKEGMSKKEAKAFVKKFN